LYAAAVLLVSLFGALSYRAFVLQVREAERLRVMAQEQYLQNVELPPKRGRILDRHGAELAVSAEVDSVHVNSRALLGSGRFDEVARALSEALHLDRRELDRRLRARRFFTWVKRRVTPDEARAVRELALPNVYLDREPRRYYPNRGLAGPILGWAGLDARGQEGIELQYDRWLRGERGQVQGLRDALGRAVLVGGLGDGREVAGHDLETTIDRSIQFRLERSLESSVTKHRAKAGVAVALDPRTGEILAMAAVPSLNPNEPEGARERGVRNRAVTDPFEPGSTMKTFSITGALEAGVVRVDEDWDCEWGHYQIAGRTIHDAERIGEVTTAGVLAKSSNICTAKIAMREGHERLHDIFLRFGFGRPTGVDLPGERAGQVRSVQKMGPVETATMSYGQGITATPLQMAAAYATVANGGVWHRPHVLRRVLDGAGRTVLPEPNDGDGRRVIDPELAGTMRTMLVGVTQKGGTAASLSLPGYTFAGKTGTAQKVDPVTRHYSPENWASSFVGFAPAENPRLLLFVLVDEPQGTHLGALVAGPVFAEVMADALRLLGVAPDAPVPAAPPPVATRPHPPGAREPALAPAVRIAETQEADAAPDPAEDDGPMSDDPADVVPDFTGMSVTEALEAARKLGLRVEVLGSGVASGQSPGPGEVRRGPCRVMFTPPG
jgi:cell division protein FtsI (penicillin-binding protein 3)